MIAIWTVQCTPNILGVAELEEAGFGPGYTTITLLPTSENAADLPLLKHVEWREDKKIKN